MGIMEHAGEHKRDEPEGLYTELIEAQLDLFPQIEYWSCHSLVAQKQNSTPAVSSKIREMRSIGRKCTKFSCPELGWQQHTPTDPGQLHECVYMSDLVCWRRYKLALCLVLNIPLVHAKQFSSPRSVSQAEHWYTKQSNSSTTWMEGPLGVYSLWTRAQSS